MYWICFACGDGSQFASKEAFVKHIKSNHAATIPLNKIQVLVELSQKTTPTEIQHCPLCNWPEEEGVEVDKNVLLNHIAKDIHSFSLRALPWADGDGEESDDRIRDSSEKVYEWLVQNEIQTNPGMVPVPPRREKEIRQSEYFRQNGYFAGSSKASSSTKIDSVGSRDNELEELRRLGDLAFQEQEAEEDTQKVPSSAKADPKTSQDYTMVWICALPVEATAATLVLDEWHHAPLIKPGDPNVYYFGKIGSHNVVISILPQHTPITDSEVPIERATFYLSESFPNLRFILIVGIGGGVPSSLNDVRLGDVVVGVPSSKNDIRLGDIVIPFRHPDHGGVVRYDLGRSPTDQLFKSIEFLDPPPTFLLTAVNALKDEYDMTLEGIDGTISKALEHNIRLRKKFERPDPATDQLYQCHIVHPQHDEHNLAPDFKGDQSCLVLRHPRDGFKTTVVHYGTIASGNHIIKDGKIRDQLAAQDDVLCFGAEMVGLPPKIPSLVIRGISDYADSHKNKVWQGYAAMAAAAYARDLLYRIPSQI